VLNAMITVSMRSFLTRERAIRASRARTAVVATRYLVNPGYWDSEVGRRSINERTVGRLNYGG